ncbi:MULTISPECIES: hypothetical protein [Sporomusa]|jgi:predicted oxidoreductase (fatty acid repression mutant protein)|uniref:hypothetical protein n=1 Tax=Sporomusa TaxID=2375 RepID=UPI002CD30C2D|nr:hypothetical protein [Sporomusa sphaeroides]HML33922.1 hypothetical protein [Sporomusa sphaeroides]
MTAICYDSEVFRNDCTNLLRKKVQSQITLNRSDVCYNLENGNNKKSDKYNNIKSTVVTFDNKAFGSLNLECVAATLTCENELTSEIIVVSSLDILKTREVDDVKQQSSILKIAYSAILFFSIVMSVGVTLLLLPQTTVIQKHFGFLAFSGGFLALAFLAYDGLQNGWRHNPK